MMRDNLPILIELVFVFGGVLLFAGWQLHEIKVDQRKAARKRAKEEEACGAAPSQTVGVVQEAGAAGAADSPAADPPSADPAFAGPPAADAPQAASANPAAASDPPQHAPQAARRDA